jgi:hypothetical protein
LPQARSDDNRVQVKAEHVVGMAQHQLWRVCVHREGLEHAAVDAPGAEPERSASG